MWTHKLQPQYQCQIKQFFQCVTITRHIDTSTVLISTTANLPIRFQLLPIVVKNEILGTKGLP